MHIERLVLHNFRNYQHVDLSFSPKLNIFWGNNGQGKTNLLEAIHVLSTGRSFRTARLQDLIRDGATFFSIEASFYKDEMGQTIQVYYNKTTKKIVYNQASHSHFSNLLGILPSVLLSPDDLSIISGAPAERRRFLDLHIAQMDPLYLYYLNRYHKAVKQRNELLRTRKEETLTAWEHVMATAACYLIAQRKQASQYLQGPTSQWMELFSKAEPLHLHYESTLSPHDQEQNCLTQWHKARLKEMQYGTTLIGPHRDDLSIIHCEKEAKYFSSEGQKRSCIIALRFAQWEHMNSFMENSPLLSIDDYGIQLDPYRHQQLSHHMDRFGQVFLSSPQAIQPLSTSCHSFHVNCGTVTVS